MHMPTENGRAAKRFFHRAERRRPSFPRLRHARSVLRGASQIGRLSRFGHTVQPLTARDPRYPAPSSVPTVDGCGRTGCASSQ